MANNNRTISINFPFKDDLTDGKLLKMNTTTVDDIRSSLYFFITTKKGERWYDPNFGTKLYEFLFEKNDEITAAQIKESLKADIERYFNNVTIKDITIDQSEETNKLTINISFIYTNLYNTVDDNIAFVFGI
jgi:phage baseplate assembly protein W